MRLHRFHLVPESAWRTPWQSDTLSGMLCGAIARLEGDDVLRQRVIAPAIANQPPFVLSDAFPAEYLPIPGHVRLFDWPDNLRKSVKRARWMSRETFRILQQGEGLCPADLVNDSHCFHDSSHLHNTISRTGNLKANTGGLFARDETLLAKELSHLTIYVRLEDDFHDLFWRALNELATSGFGADRSTGKGQFRIEGTLEPAADLDIVNKPNAAFVLSTFQPGDKDPTDGAWDAFTKYGKLGPEFGLDNVFKRPLILLKPGAAFRMASSRPWVGRAIPMDELLAADSRDHLHSQGVEIIHYAFGLAVPAVWRTDQRIWDVSPVKQRPVVSVPLPPSQVATVDDLRRISSSDAVQVVLLERLEKAGPNAFRVQEAGKPKGVLNHGTPPTPLPEIGAAVSVYNEPTSQPNNPTYRWSPLPKRAPSSKISHSTRGKR